MARRGRPRGFDRNAALDTAMRLFCERGYEGVSLAELTAAMGVNPPSLYAAFGSKQALFLEAVELYRKTVFAPVIAALASEGPVKAALADMLARAASAFAAPERPGGSLSVLGAINCASENAGLRALLAEGRNETERLISERLERARAAGDLPAKADAAAVAGFYAAILHGLALAGFDGATSEALAAIAERGVAAFEAVTGAKPAGSGSRPAAKAAEPAAKAAPQLTLF